MTLAPVSVNLPSSRTPTHHRLRRLAAVPDRVTGPSGPGPGVDPTTVTVPRVTCLLTPDDAKRLPLALELAQGRARIWASTVGGGLEGSNCASGMVASSRSPPLQPAVTRTTTVKTTTVATAEGGSAACAGWTARPMMAAWTSSVVTTGHHRGERGARLAGGLCHPVNRRPRAGFLDDRSASGPLTVVAPCSPAIRRGRRAPGPSRPGLAAWPAPLGAQAGRRRW
jgi:hypothetical protein